jgi:hypothetical protein
MTGDLMKPNISFDIILRATIVFLQKLSMQRKIDTIASSNQTRLNKQSFFVTVIESIYWRKSFASETGIASVSSIASE